MQKVLTQIAATLGRTWPWVLAVSLILNIGLLGYSATNHQDSSIREALARYPLIDPARSIIDQVHFFSTINPLRQELRAIVQKYESQGNQIGLYFEYLNTGANVSINQDKRFWPASLSKMPTALAVMKKIQDNEWKLNNELVLFEEDKRDNYGQLYKMPTGTRLTIETLLKKLLLDSDNTASRIFIRNLEAENFSEISEALGMKEMFNEELKITAKEYSRIFRALYSSSYLKREYSEQLLEWLSETSFTTFLDAGIPDDVKFSHKIGEQYKEKVFLDSGITYVPNRPYLMTVIIEVRQDEDINKAREIMAEISKVVYEYVAHN